MDGVAFVEQLKAENEALLCKLDADPGAQTPDLGPLLKMALKNEAEAAEIAAQWVATTPELDAKLALARHAGDEARHYELLAAAVGEHGVGLAGFDPLHPPSPVLEYLRTLETTAERVAAALVTREAMGARRNAQFLKLLESGGNNDLAALYRDVINPDEERHHRSGCELLARLAVSPDTQERARRAARRLLEIGDRVRTAVMEKTGAACVPGC
ncbi:MAG: ferritin-like domain-containing protein [Terriglobales bacterium]